MRVLRAPLRADARARPARRESVPRAANRRGHESARPAGATRLLGAAKNAVYNRLSIWPWPAGAAHLPRISGPSAGDGGPSGSLGPRRGARTGGDGDSPEAPRRGVCADKRAAKGAGESAAPRKRAAWIGPIQV